MKISIVSHKSMWFLAYEFMTYYKLYRKLTVLPNSIINFVKLLIKKYATNSKNIVWIGFSSIGTF